MTQNDNNQEIIDLEEKIKKTQAEADAQNQSSQDEDEELTKLKQELEQMSELAKRTMADFHNFKRRQEEEKGMLIKMANIGLIKAILPTLDNLHRAEAEWTEGVKMCVNQLEKTLADAGLEEMKAEGEEFNPELHEALVQVPGAQDMVVKVIEKGYKVGDRVVRHAKVQVGNGQ